PPGPQRALVVTCEAREPDRTRGAGGQIAELQLENSRLRRLVTDLLLGKVKLEEAAQSQARACVLPCYTRWLAGGRRRRANGARGIPLRWRWMHFGHRRLGDYTRSQASRVDASAGRRFGSAPPHASRQTC